MKLRLQAYSAGTIIKHANFHKHLLLLAKTVIFEVKKKLITMALISNFLIPIFLRPDVVELRYLKSLIHRVFFYRVEISKKFVGSNQFLCN